MDFVDQIKQFSKRIDGIRGSLQTEEATKTALIMPFFSMLGYDVFNPLEFTPEFTADVGIKKGEKVDYAIMVNNDPVILIEAKWIGAPLEQHDSQLFRYFGTTSAKFGILTNGQFYRFYTDLDTPNKMDLKPFLEIDVCNIKEAQVQELKKFCKGNLDVNELLNAASELRYSSAFSKKFSNELTEPSDELVRFFLTDAYDGIKTQSTIDKFRPVLKKTLHDFIDDLMNQRIKTAFNKKPEEPEEPLPAPTGDEKTNATESSKIVTTHSEIEAFAIVRSILREVVAPMKVFYRDTQSYFGILLNDNNRQWICRLRLGENRNTISYPDENKKEITVELESLYEIEKYKKELIDVVKRYLP